MSPLVSVITPLRRGDEVLSRCRASLYSQTVTNWDWIIVESAAGAPVNRNVGAEGARGRFLYFLDADVELSPDCFARHLQTLHDWPHAAYAYSGFRWAGAIEQVHTPPAFDGEALQRGPNYVSTMSMIRGSCFPGWDERCPRLQDWELFSRMWHLGLRGVRTTPEPLFTAWSKPGDISTG